MRFSIYSANYYQERLPGVEDTLLLIEVSDSTLMDDLTIKVPRYAEAGVREVWIIDVNSNVITQYHTPQEDVYAYQVRYKRDEEIPTTLGVTVPVIDVLG